MSGLNYLNYFEILSTTEYIFVIFVFLITSNILTSDVYIKKKIVYEYSISFFKLQKKIFR